MALLFKKAPAAQEELDKARVCGKWDQVLSLEQRYKNKSAISNGLRCVVKAEAILEQWLLSQTAALPAEALDQLNHVVKTPNEDPVLLGEALIILGKCYWYSEHYKEALKVLSQVNVARPSSLHHHKLLIDYYAFYGLCQEHAAQQDKALSSYEQCLRKLLELANGLESCPFRSDVPLPHSIYVAIIKGTILSLSKREYGRAIEYSRKILLAHNIVWLSGLQQVCLLLLSELLTLHYPASHHTPVAATNQHVHCATTAIEEAMLVLSLARNGVSHDASSDITILDHVITLILTEANLPSSLAEMLEETMKILHNSGPDLPQQFSLVLSAAGREKQAMTVMQENVQLCSHDPITLLMASKTALQQRRVKEALQLAKRAVPLTKGHWLLPRAHQMLGACYATLAQQEADRSCRQQYHKSAVENMRYACEHDSNNVEMSFELALQLSEGREVMAAMTEIKRALKLDGCHVNSLHLLVLLLSAEKKYKEANEVCKVALELSPTNLSVWLCSVQLELLLFGGQVALQTCKHILKVWQDKYGCIDERGNGGLLNAATKDQSLLTDLPFGEMHPSGVSFNELISDTDSTVYTTSTSPADILLAKIWCLIAEVFQVEGRYVDSLLACVKEAYLLAPSSPHVLTQLGRILEGSGRYTEASSYYCQAIAKDPSFALAMAHRGHLLAVEGDLEQAEQCLKESVERSPLDHKAWHWLGGVCEKKGETVLALNCYTTAMNFESTAAIMPFASVIDENKL